MNTILDFHPTEVMLRTKSSMLRAKHHVSVIIEIKTESRVNKMTNFNLIDNKDPYKSNDDDKVVMYDFGIGNIWVEDRYIAYRIVCSRNKEYFLIKDDDFDESFSPIKLK